MAAGQLAERGGRDVGALPAGVGGASGSFPGYLRTHGRCVRRASSPGQGGCESHGLARGLGRRLGASRPEWGSLPSPSPAQPAGPAQAPRSAREPVSFAEPQFCHTWNYLMYAKECRLIQIPNCDSHYKLELAEHIGCQALHAQLLPKPSPEFPSGLPVTELFCS